MNEHHLAVVAFYVCMYAMAASVVMVSKHSWKTIGERLEKGLPILVSILLLSGLLGFCVGGQVGMIGMTLLASLWSVWFLLLYAATGK